MTPVTETERRTWQLNAAVALTEILADAAAVHLPALTWRVTTLGLLGEVPNSYGKRDDLAEYREWVEHLQAIAQRSTTTADGILHQRASCSYRLRRGMAVQVTVLAKLQGVTFRETA